MRPADNPPRSRSMMEAGMESVWGGNDRFFLHQFSQKFVPLQIVRALMTEQAEQLALELEKFRGKFDVERPVRSKRNFDLLDDPTWPSGKDKDAGRKINGLLDVVRHKERRNLLVLTEEQH